MTYGNTAITDKEIQRKANVPAGFEGGKIKYSIPENKYFATTQADADAQAALEISTEGQAYADKYGTLVPRVYYNKELHVFYDKEGCVSPTVGDRVMNSTEEFVVAEGTFISFVSQEDVDSKAETYAAVRGKEWARKNGNCCKVWYSEEFKDCFYKSKCPSGKHSECVEYSFSRGTYISDISQEDANQQAWILFRTNGQANADSIGVCT